MTRLSTLLAWFLPVIFCHCASTTPVAEQLPVHSTEANDAPSAPEPAARGDVPPVTESPKAEAVDAAAEEAARKEAAALETCPQECRARGRACDAGCGSCSGPRCGSARGCLRGCGGRQVRCVNVCETDKGALVPR